MITRFRPPYSAVAVDNLQRRLTATRWPPVPAALSHLPPAEGFDPHRLRALCHYWQEGFDWRTQLQQMARWPHFRARLHGHSIHFLHLRRPGKNRLPLLITHGWPGSFLEFDRLIPLLADDFDLVIPSLPGYGYSPAPVKPGMGITRIAGLWAELMRALGYRRYGVQGGDIGASVSTALALRHPARVVGTHLNYIPGTYWPPHTRHLSSGERHFLQIAQAWEAEHGAYARVQDTCPLTLAYGLSDSPAGLAGWILEKMEAWSDSHGNVLRSFSRDALLANITLYWMTGSVYSSLRLYREIRRAPLRFAPGAFVTAPVAVAQFPRELPFPPQSWVERGYHLTRWTRMPRGGHFAAWEQPALLAADLRTFFGAFGS